MSKTILLTGGSRGLGRTIAEYLYPKGYRLILVARSASGLKETRESLGSNSVSNVDCIAWDLSKIDELHNLVDQIRSKYDKIDVLVNNAGVEQYGEFHKYKKEEIQRILQTNLASPIELTRLCLQELMSEKGHIINIASLAGKKGVAFNSVYSASKGGLIMWTDALRQEYFKTGHHFSVICPGFMAESGMHFDSGIKAPSFLGESQPIEVAQAVEQCIVKNKVEVIVNSGPIRPLLAIGQILPRFGDWVVRKMGLIKINKSKIGRA